MYTINLHTNTLIEVTNMKEKYTKPFIEVIFLKEDIITESNPGGSVGGGEDELPVMPF